MSPMPAMPSQAEPETLEDLRGDCRHIDASWTTPGPERTPAKTAPAGSRAPATNVPAHGATLVAGMSEYGD
ncbi:hypothetical protein [Embleya scabrispora]|uniref:hypothetical protein n=1 Tax=Embleya scabrispora TaxID=159449 RepID=UPI0003608498|nr:hypothetical protein [Embleya scabrispora]MYS87101.1 hypothetical protein [Streptomyces sp. SID5474]